MCGLVSIASLVNTCLGAPMRDVFTALLVINQLRGRDSTGVFKVNNKAELDWIKQKGGPEVLFSEDLWKERFKGPLALDTVFLAGHGRYGTSGGVDSNSAHPFCEKNAAGDNITLVHNGTLRYTYSKDFPVRMAGMVDSQWLTKCFVEMGEVATLKEIDGAAALIWWDSKKKTMNFFRNTERPLHYAIVKEPKDTYYVMATSEIAALRWAQLRFGLHFVEDKVHEFVPNTIYRIGIDELPELYDNKPWTSKEFVQPRPVVPVVYGGAGWGAKYKDEYGSGYDNINWRHGKPAVIDVPHSVIDKLARGKAKILKFLAKRPYAKELSLIYSEIHRACGTHDFVIPAFDQVKKDVKHTFTVNDLREIISYENSEDGGFTLGERVRMKITHCSIITGRPGWSRVFAKRQRQGDDIGPVFFWVEKTSDALEMTDAMKNPYWECDIEDIRIAEEEIHKTMGGKIVEICVQKKYRLYENTTVPANQVPLLQ